MTGRRRKRCGRAVPSFPAAARARRAGAGRGPKGWRRARRSRGGPARSESPVRARRSAARPPLRAANIRSFARIGVSADRRRREASRGAFGRCAGRSRRTRAIRALALRRSGRDLSEAMEAPVRRLLHPRERQGADVAAGTDFLPRPSDRDIPRRAKPAVGRGGKGSRGRHRIDVRAWRRREERRPLRRGRAGSIFLERQLMIAPKAARPEGKPSMRKALS